jgi:hypothetical protein
MFRVDGDQALRPCDRVCCDCKTPNDVDQAALKHPPTTFVHDLASRLLCRKCVKAGRRPGATLLQLALRARYGESESRWF